MPDREHGGQKTERLRVIDWENPQRTIFCLVSQMRSPVSSIHLPAGSGRVCQRAAVGGDRAEETRRAGARSVRRKPHPLQAADSALFWYNALLIASNGTDSRVGSLTADWERFFEWKRIEREDEPRRVSLEVMLRGTCDRARLLDLVENFTLFSEHKAGLVKVIGAEPPVPGRKQRHASMLGARARPVTAGRAFSGRRRAAARASRWCSSRRRFCAKSPGNWTFVVVTDRVELDDQIAKTFKAVGAVTEAEGDQCHADSGAHLRELLRGNHRYVFTLIQKFQTPELLCDRSDVIVLTDEAHRSQYDTLALNMRAALPKALFLAFTGTPLIAGEERTKEVFGDYVSIYDFQQSIEDGATVPLFYENRTPELQLVNPDLNDDIYDLIEDAELDPDQEAKLERELARQYHILTRDDRLETVAQDIVRHFLGRGFVGKAMVVSIDKATALRMYDKVRKHWAAETERVQKELRRRRRWRKPRTGSVTTQRLDVLKTTDMALVVSPGQNEIAADAEAGLDIVPHRKRMNE